MLNFFLSYRAWLFSCIFLNISTFEIVIIAHILNFICYVSRFSRHVQSKRALFSISKKWLINSYICFLLNIFGKILRLINSTSLWSPQIYPLSSLFSATKSNNSRYYFELFTNCSSKSLTRYLSLIHYMNVYFR